VSAAEIDRYLSKLQEPKRTTLQHLREAILRVVPEAEECISYRLPAFRVQGKVVAGFDSPRSKTTSATCPTVARSSSRSATSWPGTP
jgi:uncharacterized protein YdhG (YjbR/CyaY superfamily)